MHIHIEVVIHVLQVDDVDQQVMDRHVHHIVGVVLHI
jgi:hypothetical protein